MSDYTPTTDDIRHEYAASYVADHQQEGRAEFNRWLAAHNAKVRAETLRDAAAKADAWEAAGGMHGGEWFPSKWAGQVAGWLEHRADQIEAIDRMGPAAVGIFGGLAAVATTCAVAVWLDDEVAR